MSSARRPFLVYLLLLAATVALGLATRSMSDAFPKLMARYGGDTLWAAMVFWLLALWRRAATTQRLALGALTISVIVELSQLYRAPWIDALRATRGGALVLGQGFLWSDLVCYVAGVGVAAALDAGMVRYSARG